MKRNIIFGLIVVSIVSMGFSAGMFNALYFGGGIGVMTLYSTPTAISHLRIRAPYASFELGDSFKIGSRVYFTTVRVMPTVYTGIKVNLFKPNNYFSISTKPYAGVLVEKYFGKNDLYYGGLAGVTFSVTRHFMGFSKKMESFLDIVYTYVQSKNQEMVVSLGFQLGM